MFQQLLDEMCPAYDTQWQVGLRILMASAMRHPKRESAAEHAWKAQCDFLTLMTGESPADANDAPLNIIIAVRDGQIQGIRADGRCRAAVIDYDIDYATEEELESTPHIEWDEGEPEQAHAYYETPLVDPVSVRRVMDQLDAEDSEDDDEDDC